MIDPVLKAEVLTRMYREVVFGIVRTHSEETAFHAARALIEAGLGIQEVSMTTPGALQVIRRLNSQTADSGALVGAGTVLDGVTARLVIEAGARFIVSPNLSIDVIQTGNRYGVPVMPGIGSVTEVVTAMESGAEVVKAFPGSVLGPGFIKSLKGPVPQARVIPVGGVSADNLMEWLDAGAFALGMGTGLTHPGGSCEDPARIRDNAVKVLESVQTVRDSRAG